MAGAERLLKQVAHVGKAEIGDPEVFNLLGFICDQTGRFTEANAFYLEALKLAPRSTRIHNNLGAHYFRTGQIGSAQAEFETVLRLDQNDSTANHNMGLILLEQGKPENGLVFLNKARALKPEDRGVLFNLARCHLVMRQLADAKKYVGLLLDTSGKNDLETFLSVGLLFLQQGESSDAIEILKRARAAPGGALSVPGGVLSSGDPCKDIERRRSGVCQTNLRILPTHASPPASVRSPPVKDRPRLRALF